MATRFEIKQADLASRYKEYQDLFASSDNKRDRDYAQRQLANIEREWEGLHLNANVKQPRLDSFVIPTQTPSFNPGVTPDAAPPPTAPAAPAPIGPDNYGDLFKETPYFNTPGFQQILNDTIGFHKGNNVSYPKEFKSQIDTYTGIFGNIFKDKVGRAPTAEEYDQFFQSVLIPNQAYKQLLDPQRLRNESVGLIQDYYSGEAQKVQQQKAEEQAAKNVAPGSAFDTWQQNYRQNLTETEAALQDYQTRLFEKIRPQLLTSLNSQGLLNTGALNTAFAGAAKDLTQGVQDYIANARGSVNSDIANKKMMLQSLPYDVSTQNILNQIPNLYGQGTTALQNLWQMNMQDRAFANQQALMNQQLGAQPSPLSQIGGQLVGGVAAGFGQRLAGNIGKRGR